MLEEASCTDPDQSEDYVVDTEHVRISSSNGMTQHFVCTGRAMYYSSTVSVRSGDLIDMPVHSQCRIHTKGE